MSYAHRETDVRSCGATTISVGQDFVFVDSLLWAVAGDPNTDGGGALINSIDYITINNIPIIVEGDNASPDTLCFLVGGAHCNPFAVGFSDLVLVS